MPTVNEQLVDLALSHSLRLEAYKGGTAAKILALLERMDADLGAKIRALGQRGATMTQARAQELLRQVRLLTAEYTPKVNGALSKELQELALYEAGFWGKRLEKTIPIEWSITQPGPQQLWAAVFSTPFEGALLRDHVKALGARTVADLTSAIQLGFAEGETIAELARRIRGSRAAGYTDGIIQGIEGFRARALARTAVQHTAAIAREKLFEENDALIKGVEWVATLDGRTTILCASRDGQVYEVGKAPPIPAHWQCRSTLVPVVKSWNELGIPLEETNARTRASMDGYVPEKLKYEEWLKTKPEAFQKEVLGLRRWELWKAGQPLASFVMDATRGLTLPQLEKIEPIEPPTPPDPRQQFIAQMTQAREALQGLPDEATRLQHVIHTGGQLEAEMQRRLAGRMKDEVALQADLDRASQQLAATRWSLSGRAQELMRQGLAWEQFANDPVYARLLAERQAASATYDKALATRLSAKETNTAARLQAAGEVFGDIRPMGGNPFPSNYRSTSKAKTGIMEAAKFYPEAWNRLSAAAPTQLTVEFRRSRAHYQANSGPSEARIRTNGTAETAIHELAHRMEDVNRAIIASERAFYLRRTGTEQSLWLGPGYSGFERARRDKFFSAYCGKDYGGMAYELLSMGWEQYLYEGFAISPSGFQFDDEYRAWVLGVLALL